jgi:hypothetical protein
MISWDGEEHLQEKGFKEALKKKTNFLSSTGNHSYLIFFLINNLTWLSPSSGQRDKIVGWYCCGSGPEDWILCSDWELSQSFGLLLAWLSRFFLKGGQSLPVSPKCWQTCNLSRVSSHELSWKPEDAIILTLWILMSTWHSIAWCEGSKFNFVSVEFS